MSTDIAYHAAAITPRAPSARAATLALASLLLSTTAAGAATPAKTMAPDGTVAATAGADRAPAVEAGFVGKMERALAERLAGRAAAAEPVNVVYLLRSPAIAGRATDDASVDALAGGVAAGTDAAVERLRASGHRVVYRARYAPMVVAAGNAAAIRAMEAEPDVERIYLERVNQPRLGVSRRVVQADVVNGRGVSGQGVKVAIVEPGRIGPNPSLPAATPCRPEASSSINGHKTNTAGVVHSAAAVDRGVAPAVAVLDGIGASFADSEMMAATDCVIGAGAVAINYSFGTETNGVFGPLARYVDETVYNTGRTIVVAVSNFCANRMGTPEIAFNAVATGAFFDRNTVALADDVHACAVGFSAFLDPLSPNEDREEPDLVAPGHLIRTTEAGGGFAAVSGTSFAAPHVTAGIGLLRQRLPALQSQTERVRAILMASARHNVEGAAALSDRDGAGALRLAAADRVLLSNQSWYTTKPGGATGFPHAQTFFAGAGQRVRVAIAWAHKPAGSTLTEPTTDLDLVVLRPGGGVVAASLSFDNSYEIAEFVAPVSGSYTLRVSNFRSSPGTEFLGMAVSRLNL